MCRWRFFLPTTQISRLKVGDEARIVLDGMDAAWPAAITFIATDAQFTPKSVETQSEREKLMFKVKLQVPAATAAKYNGLLKAASPATVMYGLTIRRHGRQIWR